MKRGPDHPHPWLQGQQGTPGGASAAAHLLVELETRAPPSPDSGLDPAASLTPAPLRP